MSWPWSELGLPGPAGLPEIRRAYARRLKTTHPEEDPEGFQRLHDAYQQARRLARQDSRKPVPAPDPERPQRHAPPPEGPGEEAPEAEEDRDDGRRMRGGQTRKEQPRKASEEKEEGWDYDELLKGSQERKEKPRKASEEREEDWDYDELLKGSQERKEQPREASEEKEEGWDYDELLKGSQERKEKPREAAEEKEEDWDYDELLKGEEDPKTREGGKDWDYERLFAEGEEEAQAARRRKIQELREKNRARMAAQEKEQRRRAEDEEEAWAAVMAAAHALELLASTGAPLSQWREFLFSKVFWNVRANLDFIFALEDFLEQNPDLPAGVRRAIYAAYGFQNHVRPECRRLCRLLHLTRKDRWRLRWARSSLRKQWQSWPTRRRFATVFGTLFLGLMAVIAFWDLIGGAGSALGRLFPEKTPWQETMCAWLEEDYHRAFVHPYEEGEYIFAPADDTDLLFFAYQDGKREEGASGYRTNYPDRMVMEQMELFAQKWELELDFDSAGEGGYQGQLGETPGAYLMQFPLVGKGEAVTELGELLEAMKGKAWYWPRTPDFEVFLCYGDLHFYQFRSTEEEFDAPYARTLYENKFPPELCRYIAGHTGVAEEDMAPDACVLMERGIITVGEGSYCWVTAYTMPPEGVPRFHYLLSVDGRQLFSLPDGRFNAGFSQEELLDGVRTIHVLPELGSRGSIEVYRLG